jgi:hypothetical protein
MSALHDQGAAFVDDYSADANDGAVRISALHGGMINEGSIHAASMLAGPETEYTWRIQIDQPDFGGSRPPGFPILHFGLEFGCVVKLSF